MHTSTRFVGSLVLLTAGLVGMGIAQPDLMRTVGTESRQAGSHSIVISEPGRESGIVSNRIRAKSRVIQQLFLGEMTLLEAAAWFEMLNSEPADLPDMHWKRLPGKSDAEKLCRQVILWSESQLSFEQPKHVKAFVRKLNQNLDGWLASEGTVKLPGVR